MSFRNPSNSQLDKTSDRLEIEFPSQAIFPRIFSQISPRSRWDCRHGMPVTASDDLFASFSLTARSDDSERDDENLN